MRCGALGPAASVAWRARNRWAAPTSLRSSRCSGLGGGASASAPTYSCFLALYLTVAAAAWGWRRALAFTGWAGAVALAAEWTSTRIGVPFGLYHYTGETAGRELYLSNVPFFDPLSFTFLSYASLGLARQLLGASTPAPAGGSYRASHDVARRGDRSPGGARGPLVPRPHLLLSAARVVFRRAGRELRRAGWSSARRSRGAGAASETASEDLPPAWAARLPARRYHALVLYYLVLAFNLAVTGAVAEPALFWTGALLHVPLAALVVCSVRSRAQSGPAPSRAGPPRVRARERIQ